MQHPNFYELLGVTQTAEQEVIDAAYRALMRKYHPDGKTMDGAQVTRAREINEAYETLSDRRRREDYDRSLKGKSEAPSRELSSWTGGNGERANLSARQGAQQFKLCVDCAEQIQLGARKCRYCGALQEGETKSQSQTTNIHTHVYPTAPPERPVSKPKKGGCSFGAVAAVVLGLILILLLVGLSEETALDADNGIDAEINEAATADPTLEVDSGGAQPELSADESTPATDASAETSSRLVQPGTELETSYCVNAGMVDGDWLRDDDGNVVVMRNGVCRVATIAEAEGLSD